MTKKNSQQNTNKATNFSSSIYGAKAAENHANAADAMQKGMNAFRIAAQKLGAVNPKISQGNLFEYIEAAKFNADAAQKNSAFEAFVTAAEGNPHAAADLQIKNGDHLVQEVQAKSMNKTSNLADSLSKAKYKGMQKLVPKGNEEQVRKFAQKRSPSCTDDYGDTAKNVTDKLKYQGIESEGTSYQENLWAAKNPELYATVTEVKYLAKEAAVTGTNAAIAGLVIGGVISGAKNTIATLRQEISVEEAIIDTVIDSGKSASRSGITGAGGSVIRYGAKKLGIKALGKSNVAVAIAAGTIDIGAAIYSFSKADITAEELMERVGHTGLCTTYSLYTGAAAAAVLGPVGAVMGSMAGYMIAASIYQSATAIFKEARLGEVEEERIIAILNVACQTMKQQREEFKKLFEVELKARCTEFEACFAAIDQGLAAENHDSVTQSLAEFAALFGKKLQFETFIEFDDFMEYSEQSLVL